MVTTPAPSVVRDSARENSVSVTPSARGSGAAGPAGAVSPGGVAGAGAGAGVSPAGSVVSGVVAAGA